MYYEVNKIFPETEIKENDTEQSYRQRRWAATWSMSLTLLYAVQPFTMEMYKHTHSGNQLLNLYVRSGIAFK